jgi:hypothetical protein
MTAWEAIFTQSPVNHGHYADAELPQCNWQWPTRTWLQRRLEQVREQEPTAFLRSLRKLPSAVAPS